jgi:Domain of unknown function (DUF929)
MPTPQRNLGPTRRMSKKQRRRANRTPQKVSPQPWWKSSAAIGGGGAVIVVVLIVVFIIVGSKSSSTTPNGFGPAPSSVLSAVTNPSDSVVAAVGTGGQAGNLNRLSGGTVLKDAGGKPQIIYVGADFCPFCAAERWNIVMAMARFGTFSNLQQMTSSSTDVDPNTNTFTFHGSTYSSSIVDFQPVEMEDRNRQPFESPSAQVSQIFSSFNRPPYTASSGGFPFLDIAGRFTLRTTSYDPALLRGLTWDQIASDLSESSNPVTRAIVGNANYLTAAICTVTDNKPTSACSSSVIQNIEATLSAQTPVG